MKSVDRTSLLKSIMGSEVVDIDKLKQICIDGCPDSDGIRAMSWKFFLNYVPLEHAKQQQTLEYHRSLYERYVREFALENCSGSSDHPLSSKPYGDWSVFFKDNEVLLQINRDCQRLCPEFDFFRRPTEYPCCKLFGKDVPIGSLRRRIQNSCLQSQSVQRNLVGAMKIINFPISDPVQAVKLLVDKDLMTDSNTAPKYLDSQSCHNNQEEPHWEVIQRIFFIYYKTHSSQGYVQGMNEIIAPIYYVFATDPTGSCKQYAEADTFYCFHNLMTEIHSNFIRNLDSSQSVGIGGQMKTLFDYLRQFDYVLWSHLSRISLVPEHFAFRWLSLLLAREFTLPDVIRLWDTLFSDPKRFNLLPFICCAMLIFVRSQLLHSDFASAIKLLQNYPSDVDVAALLSIARKLYEKME